MGQNLTEALPSESISSNTQTHIEKRFIVTPHPVYTHNTDFKLLHEKITAKKYILRVLTIGDMHERNKIEERIFKKIANKSNYLPKLQHYIFEEEKTYCGVTTKCYLFFELGQFTTLREEILKQGVQRAPFTEEELIRGMQNVLFGLLWLRFYKEPHENINTLNIYYTNGLFVLGDPLICPASNENPQRYTSPQRQQKIDGELQSYDPFVSDVFSVAMCMLEAVKLGKADRLYKRNKKANMEMIIEQVSKVKYPKLKEILQRVLIGNSSENRQKFLEMFSKVFSEKLAISQTGSEKSNKIINKLHTLGGSKRHVSRPAERSNNFMTANEINNSSLISKHQVNPSFQMESMPVESKTNVPTISFNTMSSHTHTLLNMPERNKSVSKVPAVLSNYQLQPKKVSIYLNERSPITNPFQRKDISKYHSVEKLIPNNQSLATPIKGYNLNFDSYRRNDLLSLPLSHTKSPLRQELLSKAYDSNYNIGSYKYSYTCNPMGSYNAVGSLGSYNPGFTSFSTAGNNLNYHNSVLKSDYNNIGSKFSVDLGKLDPPNSIGIPKNSEQPQNEPISDHKFPKRISPIKKYSDKYIDKYVQNAQLENYVEIYKNKRQSAEVYKNKRQSAEVYKNKRQSDTPTINNSHNAHTPTDSKVQHHREQQIHHREQQIQKTIQEPVQALKNTPLLPNKAQLNSPEKPPSSANSDFAKIIDQNIMDLQHGFSAAIEHSIKSLQPKPITEFRQPQALKAQEQSHQQQMHQQVQLQQQEEKEQACQLQALPLMKSQIISIEGQSVDNSQIRQCNQSLILGSNEACVESIVKNSISDQDIQRYDIKDEVKPPEEAPKTPIRNYNPTMQLQYNRTIPEEDPAEEESLDEMSPHKPIGQYRQLEYENGGKYCGFIYNNQRNGEGTFYYKDGGYYQGQWKDNAMNGFGKLFYDDGSIAYEGQWHHDEFHGRGKVYNDTANELLSSFDYQTFEDYELYWTQYDGELSHDLKEGYGKLSFSNSEFYMGKFRNDRPQGEGHFHAKSKIVKGIWAQGKLIKQF